jgi:hypothetical protein
MAMMEPVRGLSQFVAVLADLRDGARSPYPFYCALLYTVAEGIDAELAAYVDAHCDELDAMTGDRGLESAASAAGSMEKVVVFGATILTTVLGIPAAADPSPAGG